MTEEFNEDDFKKMFGQSNSDSGFEVAIDTVASIYKGLRSNGLGIKEAAVVVAEIMKSGGDSDGES